VDVVERIAENAKPHIESDESVVAAFAAHTASQIPAAAAAALLVIVVMAFDVPPLVEALLLLAALAPAVWYFVRNENLIVIATERRTLLARSGTFSGARVEEVIAEYGVDVRFGPTSGSIHETDALGRTMYVQRRFFDEVTKADTR